MGLDSFFNPASVALIGATDREGAAGAEVLENLLKDRRRQIYPINPHRKKVFDLDCYSSVLDLPQIPELAIIVTPSETVPDIFKECGKAGIKAAIIISTGFKEKGRSGHRLESRVARTLTKYGIRVIGPNCMGVIRPSTGLNTTFFMGMPKPGNVAFLSQSGALGAGILDWSIRKNIGFSAFISLGSMVDVDFGDLVDYFGEDPATRSIIIYPESIRNVKKFISAVRGFARTKPVLVLKPGRYTETARALLSHTGSMVGENMHYDAIFRRAGAVRVEELRDLFNCTTFLNGNIPPLGPNLAIITNGGGPAVLAIDYLIQRGGKLAKLSKETIRNLDKVLLPNWSKANPLDLREDASARHYLEAIRTVSTCPDVNGIIAIYTPQGRAPVEVARTIIKEHLSCRKPLLAVWIGGNEIAEARQLFYDNNVATFEFPEEAIKTYMYMYEYARNLQMLYETPGKSGVEGAAQQHLKTVIKRTIRNGITLLSAENVDRFLSTYGIDAVKPLAVKDIRDVEVGAERTGFPLVMKVNSPDISHKSEVGGVITNIKSKAEAVLAYQKIMDNVENQRKNAKILGVNLFQYIEANGPELLVGSKKDINCGPVVAFGLGGRSAEYFNDIAVGLPPLNQALARRIIEQTGIYEVLLKELRTDAEANLKSLDDVLVKVSEMVADFPEISELDLNPVILKNNRAIVLDARIVVDMTCNRDNDYNHLVITPYPNQYIRPWWCKDGRQVLLRPVRPEDENMERDAYERLSEESKRLRYFSPFGKATHEMLTRFCNIDYDREMVIIAENNENDTKRSVGNAWLMVQADGRNAEFSVLVAEDFRGVGLGLKFVDMLIGISRDKGLEMIYGLVLKDNFRMISLAKRLGFEVHNYDSDQLKLVLELQ